MPRPTRRSRQSGVTSVQMLAILVPVLFAFIGFAVDLGRLYLIRGELQTAADAMALAAATKLAGTEESTTKAAELVQLLMAESANGGNRYDFGSRAIGTSDGFLASDVPEPTFYASRASAAGGEGGEATGSAARYVKVSLRVDAPLLFFGFLGLGQERRTSVMVEGTAGLSAPLCTVCNIEPIAIAALDAADETNYGLVPGGRYTMGFYCNGGLQPGPLNPGGQRLQYLMLNRYDEVATVFADELSQAYRVGVQGLPPSPREGYSCFNVNTDESSWVNAAPVACMLNRVPAVVNSFVCGLANRFDSQVPVSCAAVPEADTMALLSPPDTDIADLEEYPTYAGNGRRVITIPIVQTLTPGEPMRILGFRQFFLEPHPSLTTINAADPNARFMVIYIGSPVPVRQGKFGGCTLTSGPGKAILH